MGGITEPTFLAALLFDCRGQVACAPGGIARIDLVELLRPRNPKLADLVMVKHGTVVAVVSERNYQPGTFTLRSRPRSG
jgi:hypothetical protein